MTKFSRSLLLLLVILAISNTYSMELDPKIPVFLSEDPGCKKYTGKLKNGDTITCTACDLYFDKFDIHCEFKGEYDNYRKPNGYYYYRGLHELYMKQNTKPN